MEESSNKKGDAVIRKYNAKNSLADYLPEYIKIFFYAVALFIILFPLLWMILTSLKSEQEYLLAPTNLFPQKISFDNFASLFNSHFFISGFFNSFVIASGTMLLTMSIASTAAYSLIFGSISNSAKKFIVAWLLIQRMYPAILVAIPSFAIISKLGLIDTLFPLIFMNVSFNLPLAIIFMSGFYREVPLEVEEHGFLEGCSFFQRFFFISTPMVKSGLVAVSIITFIAGWNEFLYAVILSIRRVKPLTVIMSGFITDKGLEWGTIAGMTLVTIAPVLFFICILQSDAIQTITEKVVKESNRPETNLSV